MPSWLCFTLKIVVILFLFLGNTALIAAGTILLLSTKFAAAGGSFDKKRRDGAILLTFGFIALIAEVALSRFFYFRRNGGAKFARVTLVSLWVFRLIIAGISLIFGGFAGWVSAGDAKTAEKRDSMCITASIMVSLGVLSLLISLCVPHLCLRCCRSETAEPPEVAKDALQPETALHRSKKGVDGIGGP